MYPFHAESDHYVDLLDPVGYFNHTVENDGVGVFRSNATMQIGMDSEDTSKEVGLEQWERYIHKELIMKLIIMEYMAMLVVGEGLNRGVHGWGG